MKFNILFQDTDYVAIDKPSGILVHPTQISSDRISCLGVLKEQIGCWIYPVHRLDRATSGVLVFALSSDSARALKELWPQGKVIKTYRAVVRGFLPENGEIDRPLRESKDKERVPAMSRYRRLAQVERSDAVGKYASARYSLAEVETLTGRYHQVRKHLAGISHPIVGDTRYGDGDHNRYFREKFGVHRLLLHAQELRFVHPRTDEKVQLVAPEPPEFKAAF